MKAMRDYSYPLSFIPSSFTGKFHPKDEIGRYGLVKHIERVCWFIDKISLELSLSDNMRDAMITAAYFHDLGKVWQIKIFRKIVYKNDKVYHETEVVREERKKDNHPILSTKIAREYLERENVEESMIDLVVSLVSTHMSHWYPWCPQPNTEYERLFALADFLASRRDLEIKGGRGKFLQELLSYIKMLLTLEIHLI